MSNTILKIDGKEINLVPPIASETDLGGIKAKPKTDESVEVAIDSSTGKLYVPEQGQPTQEQVSTAVENYLTENPVSGMTTEEKDVGIFLGDNSTHKSSYCLIQGNSVMCNASDSIGTIDVTTSTGEGNNISNNVLVRND